MSLPKAVEKLGAKLEGILTQNVYLMDVIKGIPCCYGILKEMNGTDKRFRIWGIGIIIICRPINN